MDINPATATVQCTVQIQGEPAADTIGLLFEQLLARNRAHVFYEWCRDLLVQQVTPLRAGAPVQLTLGEDLLNRILHISAEQNGKIVAYSFTHGHFGHPVTGLSH